MYQNQDGNLLRLSRQWHKYYSAHHYVMLIGVCSKGDAVRARRNLQQFVHDIQTGHGLISKHFDCHVLLTQAVDYED